MSERITRENLESRVENLNRRMEVHGSAIRYQVQGRSDYIGLDRFTRERGHGWIMQSTVTCGTKREVGEFLHAMMVALDDAVEKDDGISAGVDC